MSTIKTVLSLLAILGLYGVVGRMDYDDAVMMENAQKRAIHSECPAADSTPSTRQRKTQPVVMTELAEEPEISRAVPCNVFIY